MDPDAVRLRANTDTFESVDAIKQELLNTGYFSDVQVKDAKAGKDGNGVDFRLNMVLSKDVSTARRSTAVKLRLAPDLQLLPATVSARAHAARRRPVRRSSVSASTR